MLARKTLVAAVLLQPNLRVRAILCALDLWCTSTCNSRLRVSRACALVPTSASCTWTSTTPLWLASLCVFSLQMSAGQFVYPFQLDGHLITIIIEAQVDTEGMYGA